MLSILDEKTRTSLMEGHYMHKRVDVSIRYLLENSSEAIYEVTSHI